MLPAEREERLARVARGAYVAHVRAYVLVNTFLVLIWVLTGGPFWPIWPILGWGLAVVIQSVATFGRGKN